MGRQEQETPQRAEQQRAISHELRHQPLRARQQRHFATVPGSRAGGPDVQSRPLTVVVTQRQQFAR